MFRSITLVIPLYNEAHRVGRLLRVLERDNFAAGLRVEEVRLVNDGSSDETLSVLQAWKERVNDKVSFTVKVISYGRNRGRGYALRKGLSRITTDYGVYVDGDLDIPLSNIHRLVKPLSQGVDVVMGSKKMPGAVCTRPYKWLRLAMGYGHTLMAGLILGYFYWDYQGGFKAFSRRCLQVVLPQMTLERWGFDMEVVVAARRFGLSVVEVPLRWGNLTEDSRVSAVRDSLRALADMVVIRKRSLWSDLTARYAGWAQAISPAQQYEK